MESASYSAFLNNFVTNIFLNINIKVVINIFFAAASATLGVLVASKFVSFILFILTDKRKRRMDEIKELNNKMHDRLVEILEIIDQGKTDKKTKQTRIRLLYNASRLKKYDKSISDDINQLLKNLNFKSDDIVQTKNNEQSKKLVDKIRENIDKLWFG